MLRLVSVGTLAVTLLAACDDPLTVESVAGTYTATTFTVTEGDVTRDLLEEGASISLTLNADGSTSGQLFVPGGNEDGSDFDADLAGTWALDGSRVSFDQEADTFVRDLSFSAASGRLTGEATFGDATFRVVLGRQ